MIKENDQVVVFIPPTDIKTDIRLTDKEHDIIEHINQKIAALENLEQIVDFLFEKSGELLPADRMAIAFFEEDGERLTIHYVKTNYSQLYLDSTYSGDLHDSTLKKIFSEQSIRIINDLEHYVDENPHSETAQLLHKEGIQSNMTIPLLVEGRAVGVLFKSSKQKNAYSHKSAFINSLISERLSQTVEKTYIITQLSRAMHSYMEMLGFVTHELKSPLDSIITMGNTLAAGYFGEIEDKHKKYIERMINKAQYLKDLSLQYLNLARFESGRLTPDMRETDFIKEILEESLDIIHPQLTEKKITVTQKTDLPSSKITCDPSLIKIVVGNLLSNAVKYNFNSGTIEITAVIRNAALLFSVKNSGPGFSPKERTKLFRKFSRLEKEELINQKGSGIGLYTSWKIIHLHKGSIDADSEEGNWACFYFEIPLDPQ